MRFPPTPNVRAMDPAQYKAAKAVAIKTSEREARQAAEKRLVERLLRNKPGTQTPPNV